MTRKSLLNYKTKYDRRLQELINSYGIKYFTALEILQIPRAHHLGSDPPIQLFHNIIPTLIICEHMRIDCGFPITFSSTYRNEKHNEYEKGVNDSLHIMFNALDTFPLSRNQDDLAEMKRWLFTSKFEIYTSIKTKLIKINKNICGIGLYKTFIHVDTRGLIDRASPVIW